MSVNGVTGASDVYGTTYSAQAKGTETKSESQA